MSHFIFTCNLYQCIEGADKQIVGSYEEQNCEDEKTEQLSA